MRNLFHKRLTAQIVCLALFIMTIFSSFFNAKGEISFTGQEGLHIFFDGSESQIRRDIDDSAVGNERFANVDTASVSGVSPFGAAFEFKIKNKPTELFEDLLSRLQSAAIMDDYQGIAYWVKLSFNSDVADVPFAFDNYEGRHRYDGSSVRYLITKDRVLKTLRGASNKIPKDFEGWVVIPKASFTMYPYDPSQSSKKSFKSFTDFALGQMIANEYAGGTIYLDNVGAYTSFDELCETRVDSVEPSNYEDYTENMSTVYQAVSLTQENEINLNEKKNVTASIVGGGTPDGTVYQFSINATATEPDWALMIGKRYTWNENPVKENGGIAFWYKNTDKELSLPLTFETTRDTVPVPGYQSSRYKYDETKPISLIDKNKELTTYSGGKKIPANFEGWVIIPKTSLKWVSNWNGHVAFDNLPFDYFYCMSLIEPYDNMGDYKGKALQIDNVGTYEDFDLFCSTRVTKVAQTLKSYQYVYQAQSLTQQNDLSANDLKNITTSIVNAATDDGAAYQVEVNATSSSPDWAIMIAKRFSWDANRVLNDGGIAFWYKNLDKEQSIPFMFETTRDTVPAPGYQSSRYKYDETKPITLIDANKKLTTFPSGSKIPANFEGWVVIPKTSLKWINNWNGHVFFEPLPFDYFYCISINETYDDLSDFKGKPIKIDDIGVYDDFAEFTKSLTQQGSSGNTLVNDGHIAGEDNRFMTIGNGGISDYAVTDILGADLAVIDNLPKDSKQYQFNFSAQVSSFIAEIPNKNVAFKIDYAKSLVYHLDTTSLNDDTKLKLKVIDKDKDEFSLKDGQTTLYLSENKSAEVIEKNDTILPINFNGLVIVPLSGFELSKTVANGTLNYVDGVGFELSSLKGLNGKEIKLDDIGVTDREDNVFAYYAKAPIPPADYNPDKGDKDYMKITNFGSNPLLIEDMNNTLTSVIKNKTFDGYGYRVQFGLSAAKPSSTTFTIATASEGAAGIVLWLKGWENVGATLDIYVQSANGDAYKISSKKEVFAINNNSKKILTRSYGNYNLLKGFEGYLIIPFDSLQPVSGNASGAISPKNITIRVEDSSKLGADPVYVDNLGFYSDFKSLIERYSTERLITDTTHTPNYDYIGNQVDDNLGMNISNGGGDLSLVLQPKAFDAFDGINTTVSAIRNSKDGLCYAVTPVTINATASFANAVFKLHSDTDYGKGKELLNSNGGFIMWIKAPTDINSAALAVEFHENILNNSNNIVGREVFQIADAEEFYLIGPNGKYRKQLGNFVLKKGWEGYVLFPYKKMKFKYSAYYGDNKTQNEKDYPSDGVLSSLDAAVLWWWPSYLPQENVPLYVDDMGSYQSFDEVTAKYAPQGIDKFEVSNFEYLYDPNEPNPNTYMKKPTDIVNSDNLMADAKFYDYNVDSLIVRWNMMQDVNQYLVYVFENVPLGALNSTDGFQFVKTILVSGDACFVKGLKPNTQYTFQVSGADDTGQLMGGSFYSPVQMKTLVQKATYEDKSYNRTYMDTITQEIETYIPPVTEMVDNNTATKKPPIIKKKIITDDTQSPNVVLIVILVLLGFLLCGGAIVFVLLHRKRNTEE